MDHVRPSDPRRAELSRRQLLRYGAASAGTAAAAAALAPPAAAAAPEAVAPDLVETTIPELRRRLEAGETTSVALVRGYLARIREIDRKNATLRSVIEVNPDALQIAAALDAERRTTGSRGPLHGIPVLLKDNIDTADAMETTAGSLALLGSKPRQDATVAARLRAAGAVLLGKTNLSEWANFRSFQSSSGWSGRGGQTRNPWQIDRNPSGSSSGSAVAVSASFAAAALGTETNGSVLSPSSMTGGVGIKPTVGLTSRAGVIPIASTQDTVGVHSRTVHDAAVVLGSLVGIDPRDDATAGSAGRFERDYTRFLDPAGLRGARIGVPRMGMFGYSPEADAVMEGVIERLGALGATVVDPADITTMEEIMSSSVSLDVLLYEFKDNLNAYLATRTPGSPRTLAELIEANRRLADRELKWFGQELFELAQAKGPLSDPAYRAAVAETTGLSRRGITEVLRRERLDALVMSSNFPAPKTDLINGESYVAYNYSTTPFAWAGYPAVTVPAGYSFGLPIGITFGAAAYAEPTLITLAYAWEQATRVRRRPAYQAPDPNGA